MSLRRLTGTGFNELASKSSAVPRNGAVDNELGDKKRLGAFSSLESKLRTTNDEITLERVKLYESPSRGSCVESRVLTVNAICLGESIHSFWWQRNVW